MSPSRTATVWLAIDDADVEKACMRFIPHSHHYGYLTYHLSGEDENNNLVIGEPFGDLWRNHPCQ